MPRRGALGTPSLARRRPSQRTRHQQQTIPRQGSWAMVGEAGSPRWGALGMPALVRRRPSKETRRRHHAIPRQARRISPTGGGREQRRIAQSLLVQNRLAPREGKRGGHTSSGPKQGAGGAPTSGASPSRQPMRGSAGQGQLMSQTEGRLVLLPGCAPLIPLGLLAGEARDQPAPFATRDAEFEVRGLGDLVR